MLNVKLIEVETHGREEQSGTCELCFGTIWCDNPELVFENSEGETVRVLGYEWNWGDYDEIYIDNYLDFSEWLQEQEVDWERLKENGYGYLCELLWIYDEENEC